MKWINGVTDYEEWRDHEKDNRLYLYRMSVISTMLAKKEKGIPLTFADEIMLVQCIVVSALTGKLEDFWSVSSSVLMNPICQKRACVNGCICKDCYAAANVARFSYLCQALETNYLILNNFLISEKAWAILAIPSINGKARIESHGDTGSVTAAINYRRIVASHRYLDFAVFTKNAEHYEPVFVTEGKPDNMVFILSSPIVNVVMVVPTNMVKYVDHVFTVCTPEYAKEHGIEINCGTWENGILNHRCKTCLRCYTIGNPEFYIYELKK